MIRKKNNLLLLGILIVLALLLVSSCGKTPENELILAETVTTDADLAISTEQDDVTDVYTEVSSNTVDVAIESKELLGNISADSNQDVLTEGKLAVQVLAETETEIIEDNSPTTMADMSYVTVTRDGVSMYASADSNSEILKPLDNGSSVQVLEEAVDGWYYVLSGKFSGYVQAIHVMDSNEKRVADTLDSVEVSQELEEVFEDSGEVVDEYTDEPVADVKPAWVFADTKLMSSYDETSVEIKSLKQGDEIIFTDLVPGTGIAYVLVDKLFGYMPYSYVSFNFVAKKGEPLVNVPVVADNPSTEQQYAQQQPQQSYQPQQQQQPYNPVDPVVKPTEVEVEIEEILSEKELASAAEELVKYISLQSDYVATHTFSKMPQQVQITEAPKLDSGTEGYKIPLPGFFRALVYYSKEKADVIVTPSWDRTSWGKLDDISLTYWTINNGELSIGLYGTGKMPTSVGFSLSLSSSTSSSTRSITTGFITISRYTGKVEIPRLKTSMQFGAQYDKISLVLKSETGELLVDRRLTAEEYALWCDNSTELNIQLKQPRIFSGQVAMSQDLINDVTKKVTELSLLGVLSDGCDSLGFPEYILDTSVASSVKLYDDLYVVSANSRVVKVPNADEWKFVAEGVVVDGSTMIFTYKSATHTLVIKLSVKPVNNIISVESVEIDGRNIM